MPKKSQQPKDKYPRVVVHWRDTYTIDSWLPLVDAKMLEPLECTTIGYLIAETKDYIVIAQTVSGHDKCFASCAIARPMIVKVVKE